MTPSGILLASVNTRHADRVVRVLQEAIERWEATPEEDRFLDPDVVGPAPLRTRHERLYPDDGMVLRVSSRDLPRPAEAGAAAERRGRRGRAWRRHAWNLDYAWFSASEQLRFVPSALRVGAETTVPAAIARRVARLHLVDNVRGQVPAFTEQDVQQAEVRTRITHVRHDEVVLAIEGRTTAVAAGRPPADGEPDARNPEHHERGVETTLLGRAVFDRRTDRFVRFELVALGTRWGGARHNSRGRDLTANGIGFSLTLAPDDAPVAPASVWEYRW